MGLSYLNGPTLTIDYVVAPVPEPATYALLLAALGVHTLRQRRRRRVQSASALRGLRPHARTAR